MHGGPQIAVIFLLLSGTAAYSISALSLHDALPICQPYQQRKHQLYRLSRNCSKYRQQLNQYHEKYQPHQKQRSEERFSRNAETELVCRLLLEKKMKDDGLQLKIELLHGDRVYDSSR